MYYALYLVGHPLPPEPVSRTHGWHKLTFLCFDVPLNINQSINQSTTGMFVLMFSVAI
jgi:hypothetical protein